VTGDDFWIAITGLPVRLAILTAGAVVVCVLVRSVRPAAAAAIAILVTAGLTWALKELVGRPRPTGTDPPIPMPDNPSFPSGHASSAFAAGAALAVFAPRWLGAVFLAVAALVGVSRIELGVHYATDVIAGSILGALVGLATGLAVRSARPADRRSSRPPRRAPGRPRSPSSS
jgi:undecaprenyl-diphosphatase